MFQLTNCILNHNYEYSKNRNNILSGFLAGSAYYVYPELSIFGHAVTCVIETLWTRYLKSELSKPYLINLFSQLPLAKCFIAVGFGFIAHIRAYYPYITPKLLMNILAYASNFK